MNIAPRQIDEVLEAHPAVLEAAAVGVPDRFMGEDLVAFAVLRAGMMGDEMRIHFVADLPKGPSGKVQRLRLLDNMAQPAAASALYSGGHVDQTAEPPVASTVEQTIADSWAELLEQARIDPDSDFFSLGGNSLTAIKCLSKMPEKLPVALSLADFFENPTVTQQAALVTQRLDEAGRKVGDLPAKLSPTREQEASPQAIGGASRRQPIPLRARASPYPLSPRQRRMWFIRELAPEVPHYNELEAARLGGELNVDALQQALEAIVARHEVLRTTIQRTEEGAVAIVHESWPLKMKQIDLSGWAAPQREAEVERLLIDAPRRLYNLESEPGIRVTLLRLGAREHVFILMMHHIICDRWSISVLWRELAALYQAFFCGKAAALPPLPIQHGDYAVWQLQRLAEGRGAADLTYWENNLRDAPELLELPADRPRPRVQSYQGARKRFRLDRALTEGLRELSRQEKTTLFNIFAAALNTLLYRYTGSEDLVVGIPIADRDRDELQSLVGFLVDTHALRTRLSGDMTFRELLAHVQTGLVALYSHREIPFDQVVSKIRPQRDLSHGPLYQVVINGQSRTQRPFDGVHGLVGETLLTQTNSSKSDLTLYLGDSGGDIWLEVEYSTDLFDDDRIARMCGHYQTLLQSVAADPNQRLSEAPILPAQERRQVLYEWNDTEAEFPRDKCIHELFEAQVERTPEAAAVVFEDKQLTYRQLNERANQLARHLRGLGVGPDRLVAICVERSLEMAVGLLAVLKAGGAYVPLDPDYPAERLSYMLEDSAPTVLLTQRRLAGLLNGLNKGPPTIDLTTNSPKWANQPDSNPDRASVGLNPEHLAYVIYTSGSTGKPKGVMVEHRALVQHCWFCCARYQLNPDDRVLLFYSISFDPSVEKMLCTWPAGAALVLVSTNLLVPQRLWAEIRKHRVSVAGFPPPYWQLLLEFFRTAEAEGLSPLRVLTLGGDALTPQLAEQTRRELPPTQLFNVYGPTEAVISSTSFEVPHGYCGSAKATAPIGRPIANTQIYILDRREQPVPIGVAGQLHIGGIGLARGYLNQPELTKEKFVPNPFSTELGPRMYRTGDLARYLADGNIEFLGRTDQQVKIRGFRIELEEIEAVLRQQPGVDQCVVVAREDEAGDKRLAAYIVSLYPRGAPSIAELRELLKQKLPEYMVPAAYVSVGALPLTPNGKLDRSALPAPLDHAFGTRAAPKGPIETAIATIWAEFLHLERVGRHDDFFKLGGHSLMALRVIGEINKALKVRLHVPAFFQNPTIERLAKVVEQKDHVDDEPRVVRLQSGRTGLPLYFIGARPEEYRLGQLLGEDRAIFAIDAPMPVEWRRAITAADQAAPPTIEQLGALYADVLRAHAGSSPCVIAGYSLGGKIAFEAAHALQRAGGNVGLVLLVDAWAFTWSGATRGPAWQSLRSIWRGAASGTPSDPSRLARWSAPLTNSWRLFLWLMARIPQMLKDRLHSVKNRFSPEARPSGYLDKQGMPIDQTAIGRLARIAGRAWRPRPLDASGVLFRAKFPGEELLPGYDVTNGWGELFDRGLEIVQATGDHLSMVVDENLPALARQINSVLDRYETEHNVGVVRSGDEMDADRSAARPRSDQELPQTEHAIVHASL